MSESKTNNFTVTDFEHAKIRVEQGWLQGYTEEVPNGTLKIFKGIPYAAPPVGNLRFRRPQNPGRWRGIPVQRRRCAARAGVRGRKSECARRSADVGSLAVRGRLPVSQRLVTGEDAGG